MAKSPKVQRDIEFLYEIGTLRNMPRGWKQHIGFSVASDLEHTLRVVFLALLLARREGVKNEEKIIKMALVHDIAETRLSDLGYVQKVYVSEDEERAARDLFAGTMLEDLYKDILLEYKSRKSLEAKIVKDADNLDIDLELKELEEQGSALPRKWAKNRKIVRDQKLYTKSAKKLWGEIQKSDPSSWHMKANKWHHLPHAGT